MLQLQKNRELHNPKSVKLQKEAQRRGGIPALIVFFSSQILTFSVLFGMSPELLGDEPYRGIDALDEEVWF